MAHISKEDQDYLKKEFAKMINPVKLINFTQAFECQYCQVTRELLTEISELSDKISLEVYDLVKDTEKVKQYQIDKIPATIVEGTKDYGVRYFGIPAGYEFGSLIEDILDISKESTDLSEETKKQLKKLTKPIHIQVFVTPTCPYCPSAVRLAHKMAIESDMVRGDMIGSSEFPQLVNKYSVAGVPKVVINETVEFEGALPEPNYLMKVMEAEGKQKVTK